jgi:hypothetical protein
METQYGAYKEKNKKKIDEINTLHINVSFINGSKQLIININIELRYTRQCNKRETKSLDIKNFIRGKN